MTADDNNYRTPQPLYRAGGTRSDLQALCFLFPDGTAFVGKTAARERYEKTARKRFKAYGDPEIFTLDSFAPQTDTSDALLTLWRYRLSRQGIALRYYGSPANTYHVEMGDIPAHARRCGDRAILPVGLCDRAADVLKTPRPELLVFCAVFPSGICAFGMTLLRPGEVFSLSRWFASSEGERYPIVGFPHEIFFIALYPQLSSGSYPYLAAEQELSTWRAAFRSIGGQPIDLDRWKITNLYGSFIEPDARFLASLPEPLFEAITYATENWRDSLASLNFDGDDPAGSLPFGEHAPEDDDLSTVLRAIERNTRETLRYLTSYQATPKSKPARRPLASHPLLRPFSIFFAARS